MRLIISKEVGAFWRNDKCIIVFVLILEVCSEIGTWQMGLSLYRFNALPSDQVRTDDQKTTNRNNAYRCRRS